MEDYTKEGHTVIGVVGVNDSPTCGVTKTISLLDALKQKKLLGIQIEDLERSRIERFAHVLLIPCKKTLTKCSQLATISP